MGKPTNQVIHLGYCRCRAANTLICWVNPRRPMYCPECGTRVFHHYPRSKWDNTQSPATLRIENENAAFIGVD